MGGRLHNNNQFNGKVYVSWVECVYVSFFCINAHTHACGSTVTHEKDASMRPLYFSQHCVLSSLAIIMPFIVGCVVCALVVIYYR